MSDSPESIYFAYGSNLHLTQMAQRCPSSRYMGIGHLHGYKFQINQRGYANIIPSPGDFVAGLCYLLSNGDETRLDFYEGVNIGAYEKEALDAEILVARARLVGRKVSEILERGLMVSARDSEQQEVLLSESSMARGHPEVSSRAAGDVVKVLVYVSRQFITNGIPKEEYISRMNLGIADALILGLTEIYVANHIRPYIPF